MRQEFMSPKLGICLFGTLHDRATKFKEICYSKFGANFVIDLFEHYTTADAYKNLWLVNFKKRQHEINNRFEYSGCIALNVNENWDNDFIPIQYKEPALDKLYFAKGGIDLPRGATRISLAAFFASSHIFDMACSFGLARGKFPFGIKARTDEEEFYHYLKSLKIKTECVNYENSSLFERTT
jgi:hypothetical protein